jgi:hypothetical protein
MLLLFFNPQGAGIAGVDIAQVIDEMLPTLGATSLGDVSWCLADGSEFYQWADEYAKRLAHRCGVFVERDTLTTVEPGTAVYPVPEGHIDTIHVSITTSGGDGTPLRLRPSTVRDLNALDATWPTTTGIVTRYSMDAGGVGTITLYQNPSSSGNAGMLAVIFHQFPAAIALGSSVVQIASPIGDYFQYGMLAEARRKQSEGAMPEMADHFDQRVAMYEQVMLKYWGPDE